MDKNHIKRKVLKTMRELFEEGSFNEYGKDKLLIALFNHLGIEGEKLNKEKNGN